jgi:hypothetical protein
VPETDTVERAAGADADDRKRWRKRARVGPRIGLLQIVHLDSLGLVEHALASAATRQ